MDERVPHAHYVTMELHEEYARRMEEEHARQNKRLDGLEKASKETSKLALSLERMTISLQTMVEEQKSQGERLENLERRDGEMWRKVVGYVITTVIGILLGYVFKQIGL